MKRILRVLIIVIVLSAITVAGIQYVRVSNEISAAANVVEVLDRTTVEKGDLTVTVSATGSIAPVRQVPLVFQSAAPVVEILVQAGEQVQAGDMIARLDATDLEATLQDAELALEGQQLSFDALTAPPREVDVAAAEAAVTASQAAFNAALYTGPSDNDVEIARMQSELAKNQLWQTQLQADGVSLIGVEFPPEVPPEVVDAIKNFVDGLNVQNRMQFTTALTQLEYGVDIAETNYAGIQERGPDSGALNSANAVRIQTGIMLDRLVNGASDTEIQLAQFDLEQARLAVEQAREALNLTTLTAPFNGVVAENNLVLGQFPPADTYAVLLMDTGSYYVDLPIDETDIVDVQVGQPVTLTLDALPDAPITGTVTHVAVTPTRIGQLVTYIVHVELDPTEAPIRVGMSVTARIATRELSNVLLVRNRFIRIDRATQNAYLTVEYADSTFEEVEVELGVRNETFSEILSGVEAGQNIVLIPRETFIPGVRP